MLFVALIFAIILIYFCHLWHNNIYYFNKHLKHYGVPPKTFLLGHSLEFLNKKNVVHTLYNFIKSYGETIRIHIGPISDTIVTIEYSLLEFVLPHTQILKKSIDYSFLNRWLGTGLLLNNGDSKWKKHRRILAPAFHNKILEKSIYVMEKNTNILMQKLEQEVEKDSSEISKYVTLCSLDIIAEAAMGVSVNAQINEESDYVRCVKEMCRIIINRSFSPIKMYNFFYYFTDDYKREQQCLKILHGYSNEVIKMKLKEKENNHKPLNKKEKLAFLDLLLNEMDSQSLSLEDIRQEVDTFMFAGHDTTSTAISFAIFSLATNPEVQDKAVLEQKSIFNGVQRPITLNDLKQMTYLDLVIKETLRLYPSVPFYARELTKELICNGKILPKGLTITVFPFALHRNPKYYPDPEKFDPLRFEEFNEKRRFAYLPFSLGPRNCIGQNFALMEMKIVLSIFLRNFRIFQAIPEHKLELNSEIVLISSNGVRVRLRRVNFLENSDS